MKTPVPSNSIYQVASLGIFFDDLAPVLPQGGVYQTGEMVPDLLCTVCRGSRKCQKCTGSATTTFLGIPSSTFGTCRECDGTCVCPHCKKH